MKPKVGTRFLNEDIDMGHGFIQPGTIKASDAFNKFIVRLAIGIHIFVTYPY